MTVVLNASSLRTRKSLNTARYVTHFKQRDYFLFGFFTNTQEWQYCHYCKLCTVFPYICSSLHYLHQMMLANVNLIVSECKRIIVNSKKLAILAFSYCRKFVKNSIGCDDRLHQVSGAQLKGFSQYKDCILEKFTSVIESCAN